MPSNASINNKRHSARRDSTSNNGKFIAVLLSLCSNALNSCGHVCTSSDTRYDRNYIPSDDIINVLHSCGNSGQTCEQEGQDYGNAINHIAPVVQANPHNNKTGSYQLQGI